MALTGYYKTLIRPRTHRPLSMMKYDPVGKFGFSLLHTHRLSGYATEVVLGRANRLRVIICGGVEGTGQLSGVSRPSGFEEHLISFAVWRSSHRIVSNIAAQNPLIGGQACKCIPLMKHHSAQASALPGAETRKIDDSHDVRLKEELGTGLRQLQIDHQRRSVGM